MANLVVDDVQYEADDELLAKINTLISEAGVTAAEINGVDVGIVNLLEELLKVDWNERIPDEYTRRLIELAVFVDNYGAHEGASELSDVHAEYFDGNSIDIGANAERVLEAIRSGNF